MILVIMVWPFTCSVRRDYCGARMTLLVTGGAGFIGSAVVRLAVARGHNVVNIDALTYASCLANVRAVEKNPRYRFEQVDVRDRSSLDRVFHQHNPSAVLHLAAESHVDRSIDGPRGFLETNVLGTFELLEAARSHWTTRGRPSDFRFLHVSTDEVYGSLGDNGAFTESSPYEPNSPYAASKAGADHLVRAWHRTYGLPTIISNCSNNYGPYQFPEKLIPVVILNALSGMTIPVYGRGNHVRDWLYVEDHAEALLTVLEKGQPGRKYSIGGGSECTNLDLVKRICAILDQLRPGSRPYGRLISFVDDRPGHDFRYAMDDTRIKNELGWRPKVSLQEGVKRTIEWYLENELWWRSLSDRSGVGMRLGMPSHSQTDAVDDPDEVN